MIISLPWVDREINDVFNSLWSSIITPRCDTWTLFLFEANSLWWCVAHFHRLICNLPSLTLDRISRARRFALFQAGQVWWSRQAKEMNVFSLRVRSHAPAVNDREKINRFDNHRSHSTRQLAREWERETSKGRVRVSISNQSIGCKTGQV